MFNLLDQPIIQAASFTCGNIQLQIAVELTDGNLKRRFFNVKAEAYASKSSHVKATHWQPSEGGSVEIEWCEVVDFQECDEEGEEIESNATIDQLNDYVDEFFDGLEEAIDSELKGSQY